jgi:hypothetical protein
MIVNKLPTVLGRSPDADVRLDDFWASRVHCEMEGVWPAGNGIEVVW